MSIEVDITLDKARFQLRARFSVPIAGITAIFGPSGAGKTTLLRAIAGLEPNVQGEISVGGTQWQTEGGQVIPTHKRSVGYVFQDSHLFSHLNVRKNLSYGLNRTAPETQRVRFDEVVDLLAIEGLLNHRTDQLSGGQRQRVAIGRALLSSPDLLLLDEPMAALDHDSRSEILPFLERLHRTLSIPMLYVSHSTDEVTRLADHIVLMSAGKTDNYGPLLDTVVDMHSALASRANAFGILEGAVVDYDEAHRLAIVDVAGVLFRISALSAIDVNTPVRIRVVAKDVSVCLDKPKSTSILNILEARIVDIREHNEQGLCVVKLRIGGEAGEQYLLARISTYSYAQLGLSVGDPIYAQIKAMALMR